MPDDTDDKWEPEEVFKHWLEHPKPTGDDFDDYVLHERYKVYEQEAEQLRRDLFLYDLGITDDDDDFDYWVKYERLKSKYNKLK